MDGYERPPTSKLAILEEFLLLQPEVQSVAVQSLSYSNVNHTVQMFTVGRAREIAASEGYFLLPGPRNRRTAAAGIGLPEMIYPIQDRYYPDWTTMHCVAGEPRQATVYCDVWEMNWNAEKRTIFDPRAALRRIDRHAIDMGFSVLVGTEVEWSTLQRADSETAYEPVPHLQSWTSAASRTGLRSIVLDVVHALETTGVSVYNYLFAAPPSSWEIALGAFPPLQAIDNLVYTHETIREEFARHDLHATFHPHVFPTDNSTVGQHFHISINGPTADRDGPLFLAGMLHHLRCISAIVLGGYDSYGEGRKPCYGYGYVGWTDIKIAPIRRLSLNRWEVRIPDALTNPYLQVAALLAAGLIGIKQRIPLESDSLKPHSLFSETAMAQAARDANSLARMPESLSDALDLLEEHCMSEDPDTVCSWLGRELVEAYLRFKRKEADHLSLMDEHERRVALVTHV